MDTSRTEKRRSISPRSSITFVPSRPVSSHPANNESNNPEQVTPPAYEEAEWIEHEIEQYGGDEPQDPPVKFPTKSSSHPAKDPNLVAWDGPNDPENPQNWSVRYKWFMTIVVIVMTVNVCVFHFPNLAYRRNNLKFSYRTFASSAPAEATLGVIQQFNITPEVSYLVTAIFLIGYVFGVSLFLLSLNVLTP